MKVRDMTSREIEKELDDWKCVIPSSTETELIISKRVVALKQELTIKIKGRN